MNILKRVIDFMAIHVLILLYGNFQSVVREVVGQVEHPKLDISWEGQSLYYPTHDFVDETLVNLFKTKKSIRHSCGRLHFQKKNRSFLQSWAVGRVRPLRPVS